MEASQKLGEKIYAEQQAQQPKAGLNFHTSQIKLHGGSRKTETTQATDNNKGKVKAEQTEDDLPF